MEKIKEIFRSANYFCMDITDFLGKIEMKIKYLLNFKEAKEDDNARTIR